MDNDSNINGKDGMVEDALVEEEDSKNVQSSATENEDNDVENFVAAHII